MRQQTRASEAAIVCPVCAHHNAPQVFRTRDRIHNLPGEFAIHSCAQCHAYFIQPWLRTDQLALYYPPEYRRYRPAKSLDKKNYQSRWQRLVLEERYGYPKRGARISIFNTAAGTFLSFFMAHGVMPYRGDGRILDVGCGGGSYLYRLKQWGWQTYGIEPSAAGAAQARKLGLDVQHGMLREGKYPDQYFDVVRLSNVLEHLPDPKDTFEEIRRVLKPNGLVYVTVPNTRSLVFWLFQKNWYALDAPRHVISYCPKTLKTLCDATAFEMTATNFSAGPFNCVRSLRYYFDEHEGWPRWIRAIRWERSKTVRRLLKPFFLIIDSFGYGDFLHATLRPR